MINFEKKIVFFHVPKCMGTTITTSFVKNFGSEKVFTDVTVLNYLETNHSEFVKYDVLSGHITYDCLSLLNFNYDLITILRNPGRRLISLYSYYKKISSSLVNPHESIFLATKYDFHDWLEMRSDSVISMTDNSIIRQFVPERFFIDHTLNENILFSAKNFLEKFEFIGFNENQQHTNNFFKEKYNVDLNLRANYLNTSDSEDVKFSKHRLSEYLQNYCDLDCQFIMHARDIIFSKNLKSVDLDLHNRALLEFF